jgi:tRNA-specific 2-thiouridylase
MSGHGSEMARVLVAMSGGVDSSVAALRLLEAGHEVVGVFMRNGVSGGAGKSAAKSCCSASDARDAMAVAERLGVPFYPVDYAAEFGAIVAHFAEEYRNGRTPNPCVLCNSQLKFGHLFELAASFDCSMVATGHYARVVDGRLLRAVDDDKDQTYYLFGVAREALAQTAFPLGDLTKSEVRALAERAGLRTAAKPESMDICFVTSGDYRDVVRARGGMGQPGRFVDEQGNDLGAHEGVAGFTVGQRRGLPALGAPRYVRSIRPASGEVVLAPAGGLDAMEAAVRGAHWLVDAPDAGGEPLRAEVKVRARAASVPARLFIDAGGESVRVQFDEPVRAVSPGQAAVFYSGDVVLGGGWLD